MGGVLGRLRHFMFTIGEQAHDPDMHGLGSAFDSTHGRIESVSG